MCLHFAYRVGVKFQLADAPPCCVVASGGRLRALLRSRGAACYWWQGRHYLEARGRPGPRPEQLVTWRSLYAFNSSVSPREKHLSFQRWHNLMDRTS